MRQALYGTNGPKILTLREYMALEGDDPSKWVTLPYCPECGERVHAYDVLGAQGMKLAGQSLVRPKSARAVPGFHHMNGAPADCPLSFKDDRRFKDLRPYQFDARIRDKVTEKLWDPAVLALNKRVMGKLWNALTGRRTIQEGDKERLLRTVKTKLVKMEILATHPWLLPYALVLLEGPHMKVFSTGRSGQVAFKASKEKQELVYRDFEGEPRTAKLPRFLSLCFYNPSLKPNGQPRLRPMNFGQHQFFIGEKEAYILAEIKQPTSAPVPPSFFAQGKSRKSFTQTQLALPIPVQQGLHLGL